MDYTKELDYTSLNMFLSCPRKFYFRMVRNWVVDGDTPLDLAFGLAWHKGMEYGFNVLKENKGLNPLDLTDACRMGFDSVWDEYDFDPERAFPKNPTRAYDMYKTFWDRFLPEYASAELIGAESKFSIPLSSDESFPMYVGRLDNVWMKGDTLLIDEFKTTKYGNDVWLASQEMSFQVEGYLTAGKFYFDKLAKVYVVGAICQKSRFDFLRHLITRQDTAIDRFFWEIRRYAGELLRELAVLDNYRQNPEKYFPIFPRKMGLVCTSYFRPCEYMDLCKIAYNPEKYVDPPAGYISSEWRPFDED